MCIAIYKPAGVNLPNREILKRAFHTNPHGAGFMTTTKDGKSILISKGYRRFKAWYEGMKGAISKDRPAILHARIATHGKVCGQLCHPFPITENFEVMREEVQRFHGPCLAHNGVLSRISSITDDLISDSMELAQLLDQTKMHQKVRHSPNKAAWERTIETLTQGSRVIIMWPDGHVMRFGGWVKFHRADAYNIIPRCPGWRADCGRIGHRSAAPSGAQSRCARADRTGL